MILAACGLALAALAALAARCAAARWWHYLLLAVAWVPPFPLIEKWLTGDVSRYLPEGTFSEGGRGKDEIVLASVYATFALAFIVAALALWAIRVGCGQVRR